MRITENKLKRIIRESIRRILSENYTRQSEVAQAAINKLNSMGYDAHPFPEEDNYYQIAVKVKNTERDKIIRECDYIEKIIINLFKPTSVYDVEVKYDSGMFNHLRRAIITLPAVAHIQNK